MYLTRCRLPPADEQGEIYDNIGIIDRTAILILRPTFFSIFGK